MLDPAAPAPVGNMGQPIPRYDARAKVTGKALYAADMALPDVAYAYLLSSRIAKGRIKSFDLKAARALPGVVDIPDLSNGSAATSRKVKYFTEGGPASNFCGPPWLRGDRLRGSNDCSGSRRNLGSRTGRGQPDWRRLRGAGRRPGIAFRSRKGRLNRGSLSRTRDTTIPRSGISWLAEATSVKIDASYSTSDPASQPDRIVRRPNAVWNGAQLTVHEPSPECLWDQNRARCPARHRAGQIRGYQPLCRRGLRLQGRSDPTDRDRTIAARRLGRPVKLVPTREQGFTIGTFRGPEAQQRIQLAATHDGKLQALIHEGFEVTSRADPYASRGDRRFNADVRLPERREQCEDRTRRPRHTRLYASASRNALIFLCSRKRNGRTCDCAEHGSD